LITLQTVKCKHCGLIFKENDILEIDNFFLKNLGRKELISNVHFYIDTITTRKQSIMTVWFIKKSIDDVNKIIVTYSVS